MTEDEAFALYKWAYEQGYNDNPQYRMADAWEEWKSANKDSLSNK